MLPDRDVVLARLVMRLGICKRSTLEPLLRETRRSSGSDSGKPGGGSTRTSTGHYRLGQELIRRKRISPELFVLLVEEIDSSTHSCSGCETRFVALRRPSVSHIRCGHCRSTTQVPAGPSPLLVSAAQSRQERTPGKRPAAKLKAVPPSPKLANSPAKRPVREDSASPTLGSSDPDHDAGKAAVLQALAADLGLRGEALLAQQLGPYELRDVIAKGAMGVVFKACHAEMGRLVALKVLRREKAADHEHIERFRREATAIARLQHHNIVEIHDVGSAEGRPYFALELVHGMALNEVIKSKDLKISKGVRILEQICRALQHAHEQGILHRDVKPHNILVEEDGRALLTDFGLARLDDWSRLTLSGDLVGTPMFMAPEQLRGDLKMHGPATDVYAIGVILYQILSGGHLPFDARNLPELQNMVLHNEASPPSMLRKDGEEADADIEAVCLRALEKDPPDRFASAEDLADELQRWLEGRPVLTRLRGSTQRRIVRGVRRNRGMVVMIAATVLLVAASLGTATWLRHRRGRQDDQKATLTSMRRQKENASSAFARGDRALSNGMVRAATGSWAEASQSFKEARLKLNEAQRAWTDLLRSAKQLPSELSRPLLDAPELENQLRPKQQVASWMLARSAEWLGDLETASEALAATLLLIGEADQPAALQAARHTRVLLSSVEMGLGHKERANDLLAELDLTTTPVLSLEALTRQALIQLRDGQAQLTTNNLQQALASTAAARIPAPLKARAQRCLGVALAHQGKVKEARAALIQASKTHEGEWLAPLYLAWTEAMHQEGQSTAEFSLRQERSQRAQRRLATRTALRTAAVAASNEQTPTPDTKVMPAEPANQPQADDHPGINVAPGHENPEALTELLLAVEANRRFASISAVSHASAALRRDPTLVEALLERARALFHLGIVNDSSPRLPDSWGLGPEIRDRTAVADLTTARALLEEAQTVRRVCERGLVPERRFAQQPSRELPSQVTLVFMLRPERTLAEVLALWTRLCRASGDLDLAPKLGEKAHARDPGCASASLELAALLRAGSSQDRAQAQAIYEELLETSPQSVRAGTGLGLLLLHQAESTADASEQLKQETLDKARKHLERAIRRQPQHVEALSALARLESLATDSNAATRASQHWRAALTAQRHEITGLTDGEAGALIRAGRRATAWGTRKKSQAEVRRGHALFRLAYNLSPSFSLALVEAGRGAAQQQRNSEAKELLHEAQLSNPTTWEAWVDTARIRLDEKTPKNALKGLNHLFDQGGFPTEPKTHPEKQLHIDAHLLKAEAELRAFEANPTSDPPSAMLKELDAIISAPRTPRHAWKLRSELRALTGDDDGAAADRDAIQRHSAAGLRKLVAQRAQQAWTLLWSNRALDAIQLLSRTLGDDLPREARHERAYLLQLRAHCWVRLLNLSRGILDFAATAELSVHTSQQLLSYLSTDPDSGDQAAINLEAVLEGAQALRSANDWVWPEPAPAFLDGFVEFVRLEGADDPNDFIAAMRGVEAMNAFLADSPVSASGLTIRGFLHQSSGELDAARRDLEAAVHIAPNLALAHFYLARAHAAHNDRELALRSLSEACLLHFASSRRMEQDFRRGPLSAYSADPRFRELLPVLYANNTVFKLTNFRKQGVRLNRQTLQEARQSAGRSLEQIRDARILDSPAAVANSYVADVAGKLLELRAWTLERLGRLEAAEADLSAAIEVSPRLLALNLDSLSARYLELHERSEARARPSVRSQLAPYPHEEVRRALPTIIRLITGRKPSEADLDLKSAREEIAAAPHNRLAPLLLAFLKAREGDPLATSQLEEQAQDASVQPLAAYLLARAAMHQSAIGAARRWLKQATREGLTAPETIRRDPLMAPLHRR